MKENLSHFIENRKQKEIRRKEIIEKRPEIVLTPQDPQHLKGMTESHTHKNILTVNQLNGEMEEEEDWPPKSGEILAKGRQ